MNFIKKHKVKIFISFTIILILLLYLYWDAFRDVMNIIITSSIIAYILIPIKRYLVEKRNLKERTATCIVILFIILIIMGMFAFLVPNIFKEMNNLGGGLEKVYKYIESFEEKSKFLDSPILSFIYDNGKEKASSLLFTLSQNIVNSIISFSEKILSIALIPILVYYFLADGKMIIKKFFLIIPLRKRALAKKIVSDIDRLLVKYILSQLILSLLIGVLTLIILLTLKIQFPIVLSILNGIFNIIPYFGPILGAAPILFVAFMQSPTKCLWSAIAVLIIQQIEGNILSPKITGDSTNIHPLLIVILLLIGEKVGGFIGMILVIPLAVIIKVVYEDINYSLF